MTTAFIKGQHVHLVRSWNDKGTFYVVPAIVESCGMKKMTLRHRDTGAMLGRDFWPQPAREPAYFVLDGLTDAEAEAVALQAAKAYRVYQIGHFERCIEHYDAGPAYEASIRNRMATIEANGAAVIWK